MGYGGILLPAMNSAAFTTIATTGFTVAFLHAAIPTHWLPFVLASRAQKWNRAKTLVIAAGAGAGHVLFTTILGVGIVWLGIGISKKVGDSFPPIAGGALILFGLFYLARQICGGGHGHHHFFGGHSHAHHEHSHEHRHEHGEHGGMLVDLGHGFVEISVFERDISARFRLYFYNLKMHPLPSLPRAVVSMETIRPNGARQLFDFEPAESFLESTSIIPEPHEFKAILKIAHDDHAHTHETRFIENHHPDHKHTPEHESAFHAEREALAGGKLPPPTSDWVAIGSLLALLTFSPCEGFLPVYLTGIKFGWFGFFVLSAILAGATLAGMVLFTWLTLLGLEKLKLKWLERYETGILGGLLCVLGIVIMLYEH
jgi:hypothetical protein